MYFTMRAAVPEFFANRDPTLTEIKEVMKTMYVNIRVTMYINDCV